MHEWSLACALVREAETEARRRGAVKVHSIGVSVGVRTGVVPELLRRAYEMARAGSLLEAASLELDVETARGKCGGCGLEQEASWPLAICSACDLPLAEIRAGEGIYLRSLDLELERPEPGDIHV